jgi:membrane fusion protein (multidrug efflux system)
VIEKGVVAGDMVVVEGVQRVQPGMTVRPAPYPPKAAGVPSADPTAASPATAKPAAPAQK